MNALIPSIRVFRRSGPYRSPDSEERVFGRKRKRMPVPSPSVDEVDDVGEGVGRMSR
jgi:hypothetical protein